MITGILTVPSFMFDDEPSVRFLPKSTMLFPVLFTTCILSDIVSYICSPIIATVSAVSMAIAMFTGVLQLMWYKYRYEVKSFMKKVLSVKYNM